MANQEHLDILKQRVGAWNQWRKEYDNVRPDLSSANLNNAHLRGANLNNANLSSATLNNADLRSADLRGAHLRSADLRGAHLSNAYLSNADLRDAHLRGANLYGANLSDANLSDANLSSADLRDTYLHDAHLRGVHLSNADLHSAYLSNADLFGADLHSATLSKATLSDANLSRADLREADLREARVGWTTFGDVDLSVVKGLETVEHDGPSYIDFHTLVRSQGNIPEAFLKGAGISDTFIQYMRSLVGKPIDYYSCFISYSSKNQDFADRLYADLQSKGIRCWFAPHDLKIGDRYRDRIDESIRLYDKLLLILSEHAVTSSWVEREVETALEKERHLREQGNQRTVLFPVKLDDTVMQTTKAWASNVRRIWHIGDFTGWHDFTRYQRAFTKLLRDLKSEA